MTKRLPLAAILTHRAGECSLEEGYGSAVMSVRYASIGTHKLFPSLAVPLFPPAAQ